MHRNTKIMTMLGIVSTVVGFVSFYVLSYAFSRFFVGEPGQITAQNATYFVATGIAVGFFTIAMLIYPVYKHGDNSHEWEDYR